MASSADRAEEVRDRLRGKAAKREEALKKLPTFENYVDAQLRARGEEQYTTTRLNGLYYAMMTNISHNVAILRGIAEKYSGVFTDESDEFKEQQQYWGYYYTQIMLLRTFILQFYRIPKPNWNEDIMPERLYMGVLLSDEDFKKFLTKKVGLVELEADDMRDYSEISKKMQAGKDILKKEFEEERAEEEKDDDEKELA